MSISRADAARELAAIEAAALLREMLSGPRPPHVGGTFSREEMYADDEEPVVSVGRPDPLAEYIRLGRALVARLDADKDDDEADRIRDQMDDPWRRMTPEQRIAAGRDSLTWSEPPSIGREDDGEPDGPTVCDRCYGRGWHDTNPGDGEMNCFTCKGTGHVHDRPGEPGATPEDPADGGDVPVLCGVLRHVPAPAPEVQCPPAPPGSAQEPTAVIWPVIAAGVGVVVAFAGCRLMAWLLGGGK